MKKENNQEFYVEQMDVHYPRRSEIQNEIEDTFKMYASKDFIS